MIFLDGYNILFHINPDADPLQPARDALIERLKKLPFPLTVVFDAALTEENLSRGHIGKLEIVYTDPGQSADSYILLEVERRGGIVVTDDKPLARQAKALGAEVKSTDEFLEMIQQKENREATEPISSPQEIDRWLKLFEKKERPL